MNLLLIIMGNCFSCDKKFGFREKKYSKKEFQIRIYQIKNQVTNGEKYNPEKSDIEGLGHPISTEMGRGKLCEPCVINYCLHNFPVLVYKLESLNHTLKKITSEQFQAFNKTYPGFKKAYDDEIEKLDNTSVTCYWCKQSFLKKNVFSLNRDFGTILDNTSLSNKSPELNECSDCKNIRMQLTSKKLTELKIRLTSCEKKLERLGEAKTQSFIAKNSAESDAGVDQFFSLLSNRPSSKELKFYRAQSQNNYSDLELQWNQAYDEENEINSEIIVEQKELMEKHMQSTKIGSDTQAEKTITSVENTNDDSIIDNEGLKILKVRLAKGEITIDEFKELKDILQE